MPRRFRGGNRDETSTKKIVLLLAMVFALTSATSIMLTAYPQHLALTKNTTIGAIKFTDNNHVIIRGNQVSYGSGDIIPVEGRDFIRVTGRQIQVGAETYKEGVRSVPAEWHQNILVRQKIGTFDNNRPAQVIVDNAVINLILATPDVLNVNTVDIRAKDKVNRYNVQFSQNTVYINERGVMLKLVKDKAKTTVHLVGFARYDRILLRVL